MPAVHPTLHPPSPPDPGFAWRRRCAVPARPEPVDRFPHHCLRCNRVIAPTARTIERRAR